MTATRPSPFRTLFVGLLLLASCRQPTPVPLPVPPPVIGCVEKQASRRSPGPEVRVQFPPRPLLVLDSRFQEERNTNPR